MKTLFQYTRQITGLLVICLTVSLHCLAGDGIPDNEIWYTSHSGSTFSPYNSSGFGANIVSNTYENGKGIIKFDGNVTTIPNRAFQSQMDSKSYTLPNTVTSIGNSAFYDNYYLQEITFSNSLTTIGEAAFGYNFALTELHLPNTLTDLKRSAFYGCNKVTSFYSAASTPPTCGDGAIGNCHSNRKIYVPYYAVDDYKNAAGWSDYASSIEGYDSNGNKIFYTTTDGKSISVPDSTAFGPKLLTNTYEEGQGTLTFAGDITKLPEGIFKGFATLKTLTFPESVTGIEANAFDSCVNLSELNIPGSVSSFGLGIFRNCPALERFTGVYASSDGRCCVVKNVLRAFAPKGLSSYTLPEKIYAIASGAFSNSTELESITIPDSVTTFGGGIFSGCSKLSTINGKYATADNKAIVQDHSIKTIAMAGLTSYTIPQEVTSISAYCFMNCTGLTSILVGNQVKEVGDGAFQGCTGLKDISLPTTITIWPSDLFKGCTSLTKATIPAGVTMLGSGIFYGCNNITDITYKAQNATLTSYDPATMTSIFPLTATSITIGDSVQSLPSYLFCNHTGLKTITIPDSVSSLGNKIFSGCTSLDSIFVTAQNPATCKSNTFSNMGENARIYVPKELLSTYQLAPGWSDFKSLIFEIGCTISEYVLYYTTTDNQIITPYNTRALAYRIYSNTYKDGQGIMTFTGDLKFIGDSAFLNCTTLKSIKLPSSVTQLGYRSFRYCTSLTDIEFNEALDSIGYDTFSECHALQHVTFPKGLSFLDSYAFCNCNTLDSVVCPSQTPAKLGGIPFNGTATNHLRIFVPQKALYEYETQWNSLSDYIYPISNGEFHYQEIHYTSTDSTIITPSHYIGAKILSNTYENGQGTWVVDREITIVAAKAFMSLSKLSSISLPSTVRSIKGEAFYGCSSIKTIKLPDSLTYIGNAAFGECYSLENVYLPTGLKEMVGHTFGWCFAIKKITLPDSLKSIGNAFYSCKGLSEVYSEAITPPTYTGYSGNIAIFSGNPRIYVPEQSIPLYEYTPGWSTYAKNIYSSSGDTCIIHYSTTDSLSINIGRFSNAQILSNVYVNDEGTLTLDRQVTSLKDNAFCGQNTLKSIELPQAVTSIPYQAFYNCKALSRISLSDSLKTIGKFAFCDCALERVIFSDSLTRIDESAFQNCQYLDSVILPKHISYIGHNTFGYCNQLNTIYCTSNIPPSISEQAFASLPNDARIYIPGEYISDYENNYPWNIYKSHLYALSDTTYEVRYITSDSLAVTPHIKSPFNAQILSNTCKDGNGVFVVDRPVTSISSEAFYDCNTIVNIELPQTISTIYQKAFYICDTLTKVILSDSLKLIDSYAFYNCYHLDTLILPEKISNINDYAFAYCSNLKAIYCNSPVPPSINWSTFYNLPADAKFYIPEAYISDYEKASNWSSYKSKMYAISDSTYEVHYTSSDSLIVTPYTKPFNAQILSNTCKDGQGTFVLDRPVTSINSSAFYECSTLTGIDLPDSITSISDYAFYNCSRLDSVTLPKNITNIGDYAFYSCDSLSGIVLPDSLLRIENYAFEYCGKLKTVTLPAGLSYLGYRSFGSCSRLKSIYCQGAVPAELNGGSFDNLPSDALIYVPEEYYPGYEDKWSRYKSYLCILSDKTYNLHYTSSDSLIVTPHTRPFNAQILSNICKDGQGTFVLDRPVTSINANAFYECHTLTGIDLPDSITSIPSSAFYDCSRLDSIALPKNITSIGSHAFYSCDSLCRIVLPDSLESIEDYAFRYCGKLQTITLPAGLSYLGYRSFSSCSRLKSIYCQGAVPAELNGDPFGNLSSDARMYIPEEYISAYEDKWSAYKSYFCIQSDKTYKVYYTSSDSMTVTPYTRPFNAQILSNTCKDGQGTFVLDRPVTSINSRAFYQCRTLTGIDLPDSITAVPAYAFYDCDQLDSINLPQSLTNIGDYAFYSCDSLYGISLPDSLLRIENYAFEYCGKLKSITLPAGLSYLGYRSFGSCSRLERIYCKGAVPAELNGNSFESLPSDARIYVPEEYFPAYEDKWSRYNSYLYVQSDKTYELHYTSSDSLTVTPYTRPFNAQILSNTCKDGQGTFVLDRPVTSMNSNAFYQCSTLTGIDLPDSITSIPDYAFYGCSRLDSIALPQNATDIGYYTFYSCNSLNEIALPDSLLRIGNYAFEYSGGLQSITLPTRLSYLGHRSFGSCSQLRTIYCEGDIPADMNGDPFENLPNDYMIYITENLLPAYEKKWSNYKSHIFVLSDTTYEMYYTTSDSLTVNINSSNFNAKLISNKYEDGRGVLSFDRPINNIGAGAFSNNCSNLTGITIPESVEEIGDNAFAYCRGLDSVVIPNTVHTIQYKAFYQCTSLQRVVLPDSLTTIPEYCFYECYKLSDIRMPASLPSIGHRAFQECTSLKSLTLPDSLSEIADYAFSGSGIESITIPAAVTTIRGCTFEYSALKQVTFHNGINSIESHAFYDCNHLKSITYPDSVVTVAEGTFISCDSLTEVILPKNLKNIEYEAFNGCPRLAHIDLPDSLQYIDRYAFYNSGLQAVTIPSKVQSLGDNAFCNCYSLKDVTFEATEPVALLNTSVFSGNHSSRIFHVPANTAEAYKTAYNWSQYAPYIFEEGFVSPCAIHYTTSDSSLITPNTGRFYKDSLMTTNVIVYDNQNVDGEGILSMGDTVRVFGREAFSWIDRLTSITLPEVTSQISGYAFYYCQSLQSVHLKSTTPPAIESNAFHGSNSNLVIYVPAEAYDTYENCGYWDEYALYLAPEGGASRDSITYTTTDSVKLVPYNINNIRANLLSHTFDTLTGKGVMVFDRPVKSIGESTFRDCRNLKDIVLPANLVNIGSLAFYSCSSMKSVTLPSRLRSIGSQAFDYCHALDTVKCLMENPATLSSSNVFNNNSSTRLILVPEGSVATYEAADNWSNYASSIFSISILDGDMYNIRYTTKNESVISVSNNDKLFGDAKCYRNTYTVNDGGVMSFDRPIETIGENAFANKSLLKTIDIPSTVTTIEASAFEGCTALTSVSLPEGLKTIRAAAFSKCTRLQSITLPESLNGIGINAFYKCTRLSEVICTRTSAATLGENAFLETSSKLKILVPLSAFNDYESKWSGFADYIFANCDNRTVIPYTSNKSAVNPTQASSFDGKVFSNALESGEEEPEDDSHPDNEIWYTTTDGLVATLYNANAFNQTVVSNVYENEKGIITFSGPLKYIGDNAFCNCYTIKSVILPATVTQLGYRAFRYCTNLTDMQLSDGLDSIGYDTFSECHALQHITIPADVSYFSSYAFCNSYNLDSVVCLSTVPAELDGYPFNGSATNKLRIFVPEDAYNDYLSQWSKYSNYIYPLSKISSAPSLQSLTTLMKQASAADTTARKYLITMDRPITLIGAQAFKGQNALVSMTLPEGITQIGVEAFSSDSSLTTIELPSTMATIGLDAFKDCPALTRVYCHSTVPPTLGSGAFDGSAANMRICVPDSLVNTYRSADVWTDYKIHIVGDSSAAAKSYDDIEKVATPEISLANHVVTITCATTGATIHYTTDGSKPTTGSSKYTQPFTLEQNCTVTAYAVKDECFDSDTSSIDCNDFKAETPVITYSEGKITITSTQSNVTIHYTLDGSTPTVNSTVYTGPIVPTRNLTVQAIAAKDDVTDSEVAVYKVEDFYVDNPVITCNANGEVSMTTATTGARIYYTIDGSTPQKGSTLYSGPFVPSSNVLVKAIAAKSDFNNSAVTTYQVTYYTAKRPTISVVESEGSALVTISSETKNAVIWYTLDGNEPTTSSSRYSGAFSLNENCIIKAFATATDLTDSQVACDTVSLFKVAAPVIETAGTEFSITCTTAASTIYYTLDGTNPTAKSSKYETPVTVTRNCLIKAIAMRSNYNDSEVSSASISSFQTKMPALHYFEGTVTMECATDGAKIYYTTDGSRPTTASTLYKEAFVASTGIVIKAIASIDGFNDSETASMTIYPTNCDVPVASFDGEQFRFDGLADGTTVYYTLDGTYPTTDSYVYDGNPVALNDFLTVRAIAAAAEKNNSTPSSLTPRALFHRAEMTAEVKEAGALKEAFGWCQSVLSDTVVSVSGALNAADLSFIRTSGWFEQLDLSETTLPDNYLPDSAFLTSSIVSVTLPGGIDSTGVHPFGGCSHLAAIQWNASMQMPSSLLQGVDNPNLLVFVDDQQQAPEGWSNVVVDGYADSITLATSKGNCDFHAPIAFTAHKITFTRSFTQESGYRSCAGWESLSLPFDVETVEHATKGVLTPFGLEGSDRHFWLYSLQASGFTAEQVIQAQYPYLICLPHNSAYAAASDLGGTLTFSATDAYIEATGETFTGLRRGNLLFMPNFRRQSSDESTLVLNTYQTYEGNLPGSVFVSSLRDIEPFEAYLQSVSLESAPRIFSLSGDATGLETAVIESGYTVQTIRGGVRIEASADVEVPVYTLTGQRIELVVLTAGDEEELPLAPGIYLVGTQKVVVGK